VADHNIITDRRHLEQLTTRAIDDLVKLARHWLAEDEAACAPRSTGGGPSSTTRADQTGTIATGRDLADDEAAPPVDRTKYADRDRLGRLIAGTARRLREEVHRHTPRTPTRRCTCCDTETATHARNHDGDPTLCFACDRYHRAHGRHCNVNTLGEPTTKIHDGRPQVRWCNCPPSCCEVCPDHVSENRTNLSDRCAQRISRQRRAASA
jgi:hypothetical protein